MTGKIPHRTRVKMCGTTRLEDALAAVDYGLLEVGWFFFSIGMVFWVALFTGTAAWWTFRRRKQA